MSLPRLIVTGASGFVGRHLLEALKEDYRILGLARRSQARSGAPTHPNITWQQVDIADRERLARAYGDIREGGGAEAQIHLAAHYDFTGAEDPEYWRTNVDGLRNVLDFSRGLGLRRFIFASSVAASRFPARGGYLNEDSPPDGDHVYARTKAIGEAMLAEYRDDFPSTIVRFAALFSDWCEYPPLFVFLGTWLSRAWNWRILGGRGETALPYLHVREIPPFMRLILERGEDAATGEVLVASMDGAVTHRELFETATLYYHGRKAEPVHMPRLLCGPGMLARDLFGRLAGERPFEQPWMARYIDLRMTVDASRTRQLLGWSPRGRLEILRRMPFLIENLRTDPHEWHRRNREAMKRVELRGNLRIHWLLEKHEGAILRAIGERMVGREGAVRFPTYQRLDSDLYAWHRRLALRQLMNSVRTGDKGVFMTYCGDLARLRFEQGFTAEEVCSALDTINIACLGVLAEDPESAELDHEIENHVTMAVRFGCDQVIETFDLLEETRGHHAGAS